MNFAEVLRAIGPYLSKLNPDEVSKVIGALTDLASVASGPDVAKVIAAVQTLVGVYEKVRA